MPFIGDKLCKQSRCPSTEEWIKKLWYRLIMERFSCIKKGKNGLFLEIWMDLEPIIQSQVIQKVGTFVS